MEFVEAISKIEADEQSRHDKAETHVTSLHRFAKFCTMIISIGSEKGPTFSRYTIFYIRMDWTAQEKRVLDGLTSPWKIQDFLDGLAYNTSDVTFSPREVLRRKQAHCMDGALFGVAALQWLRHPPLLVDLRAVNDDDHVIAVFRQEGMWGAVAKSNTTLLRYRDPVYRSLRELALSYFPMYFNSEGEMSLREYSRPFSLRRFGPDWIFSADDMSFIGAALDATRHYPLLTKQQLLALPRVQKYLIDACFLGADRKGLYQAPQA